MQLFVGEFLDSIFSFTLPEQCGLVFDWRSKMTVEAVVCNVQLAVSKPGVLNFSTLRIPGVT